MAFRDYEHIGLVQQKYNIREVRDSFLPNLYVAPSAQFIQELEFVQQHINISYSEAAREAILFPVLKEAYKQFHQRLALWIKQHIAYDDDLQGEPDYMLSTKSKLGNEVLEKPLVAVVEAKKNDFEYGWGQCLAELVAIQKINEKSDMILYGIVSDGNLWQFGKLEKDIFVQDTKNLSIDNLEQLFGALAFVFEQMEQELERL